MNTQSVVKIAIFGAAAWFLYDWLEKSGMWAQWFGGGNAFTDPNTLLTYCNANPTASASLTSGGQSIPSTPCSQWIQAMAASHAATTTPATPAPTTTATTPTSTPIDQNLANQLLAAARAQSGNPSLTTASVSEWNWILQNKVTPNASIITSGTQYGDSKIDVTTYLQLRQQYGMSGLGAFVSFDPNGWGKYVN